MRLLFICLLFTWGCRTSPLAMGSDGGARDGGSDGPIDRTCGAIESEVGAALGAAQPCATAADCARLTTRCGLPGVCGRQAVTLDTSARVGQLIADWDRLACDQGRLCGCPAPGPSAVACTGGACKLADNCDAVALAVGDYLSSHRACSVDKDCVTASTDCGLQGVCGAPLSSSAVDGLGPLLEAWSGLGCAASGPCPDCAPPNRPGTCVAGTCS